MFQNKLKNRLVSNAIPTLFEVVTEKNVEEEQTVENVMIDDDIELVDVCLPSCSTPNTSSVHSFHSMSDAFTSTSIETCSSESQTPTSLSNHTPRKKALRKKLFKEKKCRMKLQSVIDSNKQLVDNYSIETTLRFFGKTDLN
ncbi:hypothetical protein ACI65C_004363 [Semiaphis heraclei]